MKRLATIILLTISATTYSQKLKDKLQGNWVCTKILDSNGNPTSGKFGESDEYLKFSFVKGDLSVIKAPFDRGIRIPIVYDIDYIDLFPLAVYEIPERKYTLKSLKGADLVLSTKNKSGETIDYHFINQEKFTNELSTVDHIIDCGLIIIKHIKLSKDAKGVNRVSEYRISNEVKNFYPSPIFNDYASASFGGYFTINFAFPKTYPLLETVSEELIVDFDLDGKGVSNIKIIKGLNDEINTSVIRIIKKTTKKWKPLEINEKPIRATLRFHFVFYLSVAELEIRFAK